MTRKPTLHRNRWSGLIALACMILGAAVLVVPAIATEVSR